MPRHKYQLDKSRFEPTVKNITLTNINQHQEALKKLKQKQEKAE